MKNKLTGFVQGTGSVTTGDIMKPGDHKRHRTHCKYYNNGECLNKNNSVKCMGSAHCDYYDDGIPFADIKYTDLYKAVLNNLNDYVKELKYKINFNSLEGECVQRLIIKKNIK